MRLKGKITTWNDARGFGFVTPIGGGERVFLHINDFSSRRRRPAESDIVTYELGKDEKRRTRATSVRFSVLPSARRTSPGTSKSNSGPLLFAVLFILFIAAEMARGKLPAAVLAFDTGASLVALLAYKIDKRAARKRAWRTRESTLHLFGLIGGWPGAALAQQLLRHKSSKPEFQRVFWVTVILNCTAHAWLLTSRGAEFLRIATS